MGGQILDVIRQGVWASLTGGWFVDPNLGNFCNTFHLYTWLALLLIPFVLSLVVTPAVQQPAWAAYCCFVAVAFTLLKVVNYRLHLLFDTSEAIEATHEDADGHGDTTTGDQDEPEVFELSERQPAAAIAADATATAAVAAADAGRGQDVPGSAMLRASGVPAPSPGLVPLNRAASSNSSAESTAVVVHRGAGQSQTVRSGIVSENVEGDVSQSVSMLPAAPASRYDSSMAAMFSAGVEAGSLPAAIGAAHGRRRWLESPTLLRGADSRGIGAPLYSSHHLIRRRNAVRRRTKSAHDSPRMLVSECRLSDDPRVRLEWSGSPHPSPRPRQRILSLHGSDTAGVAAGGTCTAGRSAAAMASGSGRRSSWELHMRRPLPILRHHHSDKGQRFLLGVEQAALTAASTRARSGVVVAATAAVDRAGGDSAGDLADGQDTRDFIDRVKANKTLAQARPGLSCAGSGSGNVGGWRLPSRARTRPGSSSPRSGRPAAAQTAASAAAAAAAEMDDEGESMTAASSCSDVFVGAGSVGDCDVDYDDDRNNNNGYGNGSSFPPPVAESRGRGGGEDSFADPLRLSVASAASALVASLGAAEATGIRSAAERKTEQRSTKRSLDLSSQRWGSDSATGDVPLATEHDGIAASSMRGAASCSSSSSSSAFTRCQSDDRSSAFGDSKAALRLWLMDSMESFDCRTPPPEASGRGSGPRKPGTPSLLGQRDQRFLYADDDDGVQLASRGATAALVGIAKPDQQAASSAGGHLIAEESGAADDRLSSANPSPSSVSSATEVSALLCHSAATGSWEERLYPKTALAAPGDDGAPSSTRRRRGSSSPSAAAAKLFLSAQGLHGCLHSGSGAAATTEQRGRPPAAAAGGSGTEAGPGAAAAGGGMAAAASAGGSDGDRSSDAGDDGKLHYFQDEEGNWWVYSFGPNAQPRRLGSGFRPVGSDDDDDDCECESNSGSDSLPAKPTRASRYRSPPPPPSPKPVVSRPQPAAAAQLPLAAGGGGDTLARLSLIERDLSLIDSLISRDSSGELLGRLQHVMAQGLQQQQQQQRRQQQQRSDQRGGSHSQPLDIWLPRRPPDLGSGGGGGGGAGGDATSSRAVTLSSSGFSGSSSDSQVTVREADSSGRLAAAETRRHHYYKWTLLPKVTVRIWLDRLSLLSLMDRNASIWENVASVLLAVLVSTLTSALLAQGFYHDIWILVFCAVAAGCQYSLLKSVQPDAASPTHGFNRVIVFSRAFYFCLCASLVLGLNAAAASRWVQQRSFVIYGMQLVSRDTLLLARDALAVFVLCLPIVFTVGLLPQVSTFLQFVCEQLEIHVFGGTGTSSPLTSLYAVFQSCVVAGILYSFCLIPVQLTYAQEDSSRWPAKSSKHVMFSVYCGVYVALSYLASRMPSDPTHLRTLISHWYKRTRREQPERPGTASAAAVPAAAGPSEGATAAAATPDGGSGVEDPLPRQLLALTSERVRANAIASLLIAVFAFSIHVSTVFGAALQPNLHYTLCAITAFLGFALHYVGPQLRKEYPWLCCANPLLETYERRQFEVRDAARITRFEKAYVWLCFLEKNVAYPALMLSALTVSAEHTLQLFGRFVGPLVLAVCGMKVLRSAYCDASHHYIVVAFTTLLFAFDWHTTSEQDLVLLNYAIAFVLYHKLYDFYTKIQFVLVYIAPWQLAWGSAFHAFAQPLSVPHSVMTFSQAALSAIFSAPLNPFLGSAIFITSYCRPVKFWEKDYNTKRVDHSNVRLASHLDHDLGTDDNNLNSVFYEHLTRTLQKVLCGDLMMGRWGKVTEGDMFIMASDYLNAMVHIIEMGNGLVTFQLRGLEFRGTYCQQREVDAITEGVEEDRGFCCCHPGHMPHFLSFNAAFGQRWLAWQVAAAKYVLEGYSISDNNAASMLQVYDLRLVLLTYYVKSTIFNVIQSPSLVHWLSEDDTIGILPSLRAYADDSFVDLDRSFSILIDADYDPRACGITKESFCRVYLQWIKHCAGQRAAACRPDEGALRALLDIKDHKSSPLVLLCFGVSLLARRALATASRNNYSSASVDFFLFGLHALFKGDFRVTSSRDEWVLKDVELLQKVVAPAIRMALKLHQDHFTSSEEYDNNQTLYEAIASYEQTLVISHETDPLWRSAILAGRPSLLALRHMFDEGSDSYKIIMLNKRYLSFRIIKVNRECVRGMWAGQQQELIFLRNRNTERGSIQNAKQALRNMINSSCDQPIGYPIYVSPLTTSYAGSSEQLCSVIGRELPLRGTRYGLQTAWAALRRRCGSSGGGRRGLGSATGHGAAAADSIELGTVSSAGGARHAGPPTVLLTSVTPISTAATVAGASAAMTSSADLPAATAAVRQPTVAPALPPKPASLQSASAALAGRSSSVEGGRRLEDRPRMSFT